MSPPNLESGLPAGTQGIAPPAMKDTRPMYWSMRRELWENRMIYVAPLVIAAVALFGFLISTIGLPHRRRALLMLDAEKQRVAIQQPYDVVAFVLILTAFIIGVLHCLDALHGERRDRSILFWKSLPVSDLTTVLSKASIPLVVLPLLIFPIIVATQWIMLLWTDALLLMSGMSVTTSTQLPFFRDSLILLYGLIALALWHAPIYGWLLMVSAWARRATLLWAVLPPLAIVALERIALNSSHFGLMLRDRFIGHLAKAFALPANGTLHALNQPTPGTFLSTPGLWLGLVIAAAFITAAVRLRRNREPI